MSAISTLPKRDLKLLLGIPMTIENRPYVAVPIDVLRRLLARRGPAAQKPDDLITGLVEAGPFMRDLIAGDLRAARAKAKLTQAQLATGMKVSQTRISMAESGAEKVSLAFVKRWLAACGLPEDWKPDQAKGTRKPSHR